MSCKFVINCNLVNPVAAAVEKNEFSHEINRDEINAKNDAINRLNSAVQNIQWSNWYRVCQQFVRELNEVDKSSWSCLVDNGRGDGFNFQFFSLQSFIRTTVTRKFFDPDTMSGGSDSRQFILMRQLSVS